MINKKVSVVGAGTAGLAAACRLQHAGYDVSIYELNSIPGGKMHQIKDSGFTFDVGPTIVMMPEIYEQVFTDCGKNPDDYIKMIRLEPMYNVYFKDAPEYREYKISSDLVEFNKILESKGQETSQGFYRFLSDIYERFLVAANDIIFKPFRSWRDIYNPYMIKQALKLKTFNSASNMMAKYIPDEDVQKMMSFQTLYIGVSPKQGPSLYNMIPMIELLYGVFILEGGMHSMAQGMARMFEEMGGTIHYNSKVEEIIIENQVAKGIVVNGERMYSDYVLSNVDFPYTMKYLVKDEKARGKYTPEYIDNRDYSCSCLVFYWGVDGKADELGTHNFIITEDLDKNLEQIFNGQLMEDPSVYLSILSNGDPAMAPEGKSAFYCLIPVADLEAAQYEYNEETINHYREKSLQAIEKLPGLENVRERIELEHIYTPNDYANNFSAYRGSTFGLQPTLKQSAHWRPQSKAKNCENLYFTGSSTHPGAGVPTAMIGGQIAAEELRRDEVSDPFR